MIVAVPILFRCTDILCLFANMLTQLSFFKCAELTTFAALIELIELSLTCSLRPHLVVRTERATLAQWLRVLVLR